MQSRNPLMLELLKTSIGASATATAAGSAVDLADYFPVGKREIKCVIGIILGTTSTGFVANVTLQECDSTATASFTNCTQIDGTTVTKTNSDASHALSEFHAFVTKRYVRALYNAGQATTGNTVGIVVALFPLVREQ